MTKVLIVLSGCGVQDGSEIHEAVSTLIHLDRRGAQITMAAPDKAQAKVVNHLTGEALPTERRHVLVESARIARGEIQPLSKVNGTDFDAIIFPGGFGAALNLCTFASDGPKCQVDPDVRRIVLEARKANKVLGFICIAPAIAAAVLGADYRPKLTIGTDAATAEAITACGATHVNADPTEIVVDEPNRIVSTPAYMTNERISGVFEGIGKLVEKVLALTG